MRTVNIHKARTHLSRLVEQAASGESFIIAQAGRPLVKMTRIDAPEHPRRIGFMAGEIAVADDFDRMGEDDIAGLFEGAA